VIHRRLNGPGLLLLFVAGMALGSASSAAVSYAPVSADRTPQFPADYGSHPAFRTEWWYVTGWLKTAQNESLGFQITFFRTRPDIDTGNPSQFTPQQILIAHCALSDPKRGRLWQDQRIRRVGMGLADAREGDTDVHVEGWSLQRTQSRYHAHIDGEDFGFDLNLTPVQSLMLNGEHGVSRKGPQSSAASYYYSEPHLRVKGSIERKRQTAEVTGEAWLDHEWSSEYLDSQAAGWDWIGINLDDGGALMAFRIRDLEGGERWSGGSVRGADGAVRSLRPDELQFRPMRRWQSPRTAVSYPVQWTVRVGAREIELKPLLDDQENDTRLSTGAIYWEGAVEASEQGVVIGRGYLELTGYGDRLRLR
jgi:predicted secreted hydrolase